MVNILMIRCEAHLLNDMGVCLESNDFCVETAAAEQTTRGQLRCKACSLIICEYVALTNKEIDAFLQNRNTPILWIVEKESIEIMVLSEEASFYLDCYENFGWNADEKTTQPAVRILQPST